jgi:hypothetical protein
MSGCVRFYLSQGESMRYIIAVLLLVSAVAQGAAQERPTLFVAPTTDGFENFIAAAMIKKHVAVTMVTKEDGALYVMRASAVDIQQQSTGSKVGRTGQAHQLFRSLHLL